MVIISDINADPKLKNERQPTGKTVLWTGFINPYWCAVSVPHFMFRYQQHPEASSIISAAESLGAARKGHELQITYALRFFC